MNSDPPACLGPPVLATASRTRRCTRDGLWGRMSLPTVFQRHADASDEVLALADGAPTGARRGARGRTLTYEEAERTVRRVAARFSDCGLTPGDIVALQLPPVIEAPLTMLACLGLGFVVCPLPFAWGRHEIEAAIGRIGARAIVAWSGGEGRGRVEAACRAAFRVSSIRFVFAYGEEAADGVTPLGPAFADPAREEVPRSDFPLDLDPNALAVITWDLASAAGPQALARSHNECIAAAMPLILAASLSQRATVLSPYGMASLLGLGGTLVPWLMTGGLLVLHRPFDAALWREQLSVYEPDLAVLPAELADETAAAPGARETVHVLARRAPAPVRPPGGDRPRTVDLMALGEAAVLARRLDGPAGPAGNEVAIGPIRAGGREGPVVLETRLGPASGDGRAGETRALLVRGAQTPSAILAPGGDGAGFRPAGDDGFVATGLRAGPGARETAAAIVGAEDGIVRHGAITVSLSELDALYRSCDHNADAAAAALDDPTMGSRFVAAIVPRPGEAPDPDGLIGHLRRLGVARYKLPERIVALDAIPRDGEGTITRGAIIAAL